MVYILKLIYKYLLHTKKNFYDNNKLNIYVMLSNGIKKKKK